MIDGEEPQLVAAVGEPLPPRDALIRRLQGALRAELETDDEQTSYMAATASAPVTPMSGEMESHESVVLVTRRAGKCGHGRHRCAALGSGQRRLLHRDALDALVETLATHGVLTATRD